MIVSVDKLVLIPLVNEESFIVFLNDLTRFVIDSNKYIVTVTVTERNIVNIYFLSDLADLVIRAKLTL